MKGESIMNNKRHRTVVRDGKGTDRYGIERDYSEWVKYGSILENPPTAGYPYEVWEIRDRHGRMTRVKDWGRNEGAPVFPDRVRVRFGKSGIVEVGYIRRKDGSFYASVLESFADNATRQREAYRKSALYRKIGRVKRSPKWDSLCYGIHLPDETKAAYKAAIDEACRGGYDFEFVREEI